MTGSLWRWLGGLAGVVGLVLLLSACEPPDITLTVDATFDAADAEPGDGVCDDGEGHCTLRAAVMEANQHDTAAVVLGAETYALSIPGGEEDAAATGDLDITSTVAINGVAGTVIDAGGTDRILEVVGGALTTTNVALTGGTSPEAGALEVSSGSATLLFASVGANTSPTGAGGLRVSGGDLRVHHSTVVFNEGATAGGIEVAAGTLDVRNSTISSNTATGGTGGGIAHTDGTATVSYSTITANEGGGVAAAGGLTLTASVVADQVSGDDCAGTPSSAGFNVTSDTSCELPAPGDVANADADLEPLAPLTVGGGHLPGPDSVLVDHVPAGAAGCGDSFTFDQRLQPRPQGGGCEPGALEVPAPLAEPSPVTTRNNHLGTGTLLSATSGLREDFVLAVNGPCSSREQGDLLLAVSEANFNSGNPPTGASWAGCSGGTTQPNAHHDANGYVYTVEVPDTYAGGPFGIDVYSAAHCASSNWDVHFTGQPAFTTTFRILQGTDVDDPLSNPIVAEQSFPSEQRCGGADNWNNQWRRLYTVSAPNPGERYYVQVSTHSAFTSSTPQQGTNSFALRAQASTSQTTTPCSADPGAPTSSPDCPMVYGEPWTSRFLTFDGAQPTFPLGHVDAEHRGRTLEILLFDPAEGTTSLEILDPNGDPVTFAWEVEDETGSDVEPTGGWSGTTSTLDLRGIPGPDGCGRTGNPQRGPGRNSGSKYNDRIVRVRVELPEDIEAAYGGATRWSARFTTCPAGAVTDRTTWKVQVVD